MNLLTNYFVTGTDTEVGKTLVSAALILKFRENGLNASGFKPVVAGTYFDSNGQRLNEDLETLRIACGFDTNQQSLCPYILDDAAAPNLAAQKAGLHLDRGPILTALEELSKSFNPIVVEGAGGFLVPLNEHDHLGNLAQAMNLPVILVIGMRLGCINHALLTQEAIASRQLRISGWVANTLSNRMHFLEENLETLKTRINAPFLGLIPTLPKPLKKLDKAPYSIDALRFAAQYITLPE